MVACYESVAWQRACLQSRSLATAAPVVFTVLTLSKYVTIDFLSPYCVHATLLSDVISVDLSFPFILTGYIERCKLSRDRSEDVKSEESTYIERSELSRDRSEDVKSERSTYVERSELKSRYK
jgi:hypothetical protein